MKLGKLQRKWVKSLKSHPERQMKAQLGSGNKKKYKACCLGEAGLILGTCEFKYGRLRERKSGSSGVLENSYDQMGLKSPNGKIDSMTGLADLNDDGYHTWVDIAYLIEAAPELFFTKSI